VRGIERLGGALRRLLGRQSPAAVAIAVAVALVAGLLIAVLAKSPDRPPVSAQVPAQVPAPGLAPDANPETTATATPEQAGSPLTGLPVPAGPVLIVKIDNVRQARPPLGLTAADLVYIEPVEAGLSRLIAVFSSHLPDTVGPVRSARETDLDLLPQFGTPALAYSGAAPELQPRLAAARMVSVSPAQAPQAYYRDPARRAPHNSYAHPAQLLAAAPAASTVSDIGLRFGDPAPGGSPTSHETAGYPAAAFSFDWSPPEGRWLIGADGASLLAAEGGQLGGPTVVLQSVAVRPSGISDVLGNVSPYAETVGAGNALVLRDGTRYPARWSRPNLDSGTTFTTIDGQPLRFARGQVWIVLVPA
jgi:hypothetical protein